jgi:hypothetical protein
LQGIGTYQSCHWVSPEMTSTASRQNFLLSLRWRRCWGHRNGTRLRDCTLLGHYQLNWASKACLLTTNATLLGGALPTLLPRPASNLQPNKVVLLRNVRGGRDECSHDRVDQFKPGCEEEMSQCEASNTEISRRLSSVPEDCVLSAATGNW